MQKEIFHVGDEVIFTTGHGLANKGDTGTVIKTEPMDERGHYWVHVKTSRTYTALVLAGSSICTIQKI